ncbi:MAG: hypothetical protein MUP55_00575 [Candidatus Aenigmarchaeota archaeon]|nr:hypothetical protein [Candidatus Aenigmarchaeota archaeon]
MTLLKPSFVESLFHTFFNLDPTRPQYYGLVFQTTRTIFLQLDMSDKAEELQEIIGDKLEKPLCAPLFAILDAYYLPRFYFARLAYCKIGDGIDAVQVTRLQMTVALEEVKRWCYDEVTGITPYVRFTQQNPFMPTT